VWQPAGQCLADQGETGPGMVVHGGMEHPGGLYLNSPVMNVNIIAFNVHLNAQLLKFSGMMPRCSIPALIVISLCVVQLTQ
jgi:hypothetical protein